MNNQSSIRLLNNTLLTTLMVLILLATANQAWALTGDTNGDNVVDVFDLVLVGSYFGLAADPVDGTWTPPEAGQADVAPDPVGDDVINVSDLVLVGRNFGNSANDIAAAPESPYGVQCLFVGRYFVNNAAKLSSALAEAGVKWVRMGFDWSLVEQNPGSFNWGETDIVIQRLAEVGIEPLALLMNTPLWASSVRGQMNAPPSNIDDWISFVEKVVQRYGYGGGGNRSVRYWEIWTDPSGLGFLGEPEDYVELLQTAQQTIKRIDPSAIVLIGGMGNNSLYEPQENARLQAILGEPNIGNYFDIFNVHIYGLQQENPGDAIAEFRNILQSHSLATKSIWVTETNPNQDSEENTAESLADWCGQLREAGVEKIFWFRIFNHPDDIATESYGFFKASDTSFERLSLVYYAYQGMTGIKSEGYYKDLFVNGGVGLSDIYHPLHIATMLGLSEDDYLGEDEVAQNSMIIGSLNDTNGCLFYPDGTPRYRMVHVNGGSSITHGQSLGEQGRQVFRDFVARGGSYTGTCAGAHLASHHDYLPDVDQYWFKIWPGTVTPIGYPSDPAGYSTDMALPADSPLLAYHDFGGDNFIQGIYFNPGSYAKQLAAGTEVCARYQNLPPPYGANGENQPSVWAWKDDPRISNNGRLVLTSVHPEVASSGDDGTHLLTSMILYALDGVSPPQPSVKGILSNDIPVDMIGQTELLGDKQYHYFEIIIPADCERLEVNLTGAGDNDVDLYLRFDLKPTRLFDQYDYNSDSADLNESIIVDNPQEGTWYIGVYGDHTIFNGVPYTIRAIWDTQP